MYVELGRESYDEERGCIALKGLSKRRREREIKGKMGVKEGSGRRRGGVCESGEEKKKRTVAVERRTKACYEDAGYLEEAC